MEDNKLIAQFMGGYEPEEFEDFKSDWNLLMPVVEKILDISLNMDAMEMYYNITDCVPRIDQAYVAVVDFIKQYNKNNFATLAN